MAAQQDQSDQRANSLGNGQDFVMLEPSNAIKLDEITKALSKVANQLVVDVIASDRREVHEHPQQAHQPAAVGGGSCTTRACFTIGETPLTKEHEILGSLQLRYYFAEYDEGLLDVLDKETYMFDWPKFESAADGAPLLLRDAQKEHLELLLDDLAREVDFGEEEEYCLREVAAHEHLLSICDPRLPFDILGKADFAIVDKVAMNYQNALAGLRIVIQIEKQVPSAHAQTQALLRLIASDAKSPQRVAPVVLVTNLTDYWCFMWLGKEHHVVQYVLTQADNAIRFIENIVQEEDWQDECFEIPFVEEYDGDHRHKLLMEEDE